MNASTSTGIAPVSGAAQPEKRESGCGGKGSLIAGRNKWFLIVAVVLAVAGLVLGSSILGFAAILPLLYVLPCLFMAAMCMRGHGGGGTSNYGNGS